MGIRTAAKVSFGLGVLSLLAVLVGHLALTDIYHGETDTSQEWRALQVCAAIIVVFHVATVATLWRLLRRAPLD